MSDILTWLDRYAKPPKLAVGDRVMVRNHPELGEWEIIRLTPDGRYRLSNLWTPGVWRTADGYELMRKRGWHVMGR